MPSVVMALARSGGYWSGQMLLDLCHRLSKEDFGAWQPAQLRRLVFALRERIDCCPIPEAEGRGQRAEGGEAVQERQQDSNMFPFEMTSSQMEKQRRRPGAMEMSGYRQEGHEHLTRRSDGRFMSPEQLEASRRMAANRAESFLMLTMPRMGS